MHKWLGGTCQGSSFVGNVLYTFAPLATSARVIIKPIPVPPPVTMAVTWETSKSRAPLSCSLSALPLIVLVNWYEFLGVKKVRTEGAVRVKRRSMLKVEGNVQEDARKYHKANVASWQHHDVEMLR